MPQRIDASAAWYPVNLVARIKEQNGRLGQRLAVLHEAHEQRVGNMWRSGRRAHRQAVVAGTI